MYFHDPRNFCYFGLTCFPPSTLKGQLPLVSTIIHGYGGPWTNVIIVTSDHSSDEHLPGYGVLMGGSQLADLFHQLKKAKHTD